MKKFVKWFNDIFITIVLTLIYFIFLGLSWLLLKINQIFNKQKNDNSYWIDEEIKNLSLEDLKSPY